MHVAMKDHKLSDKIVFFNIVSMMNKQVEGAAEEDGRTRSIWDVFAHAGFYYLLFLLSISLYRDFNKRCTHKLDVSFAGHSGGATGDVACDQYHKYKVPFSHLL